MPADVRLIAFYLPQFHPIPENDEWWGAGFTEWTNVRRAVPQYSGHYQPRVPGELGYYDLRSAAVHHAQAALAREYGVHGFCYYYYWFSGRRLLEQPLDLMLADRSLTQPFCVCWANETWSRRWDGSESDILIEQQYRPDDPERFIRDLTPILSDPRYIRVGGALLLLVYRPAVIPDLRSTLRRWRDAAAATGIGALHICAMQTSLYASGLDDGFDAMVEFPPHSIVVGEITATLPDLPSDFTGKVFAYGDVVRYCTERENVARVPLYRGVMSGWDNTARRGRASHIFHDATPEQYEVWLRQAVDHTIRNHDGDRRLVFVNAWNEWAEGAYLEPDRKYARRYLEATARGLTGTPRREALLERLRQAIAGNSEAASVLHELERVLEIDAHLATVGVALRDGNQSREGVTTKFGPVDGSPFVLPAHPRADELEGFLDALNTPNYHQGVTLDRRYDVLIQGWAASRRIEADANTPVIFVMTNLETGSRFAARLLGRVRREDVAAHLQARSRFRRVRAECALFSGFRAYLDIQALDPGQYKLEVVIPTADATRGAVMPIAVPIAVI
jgi:hypothetical protein